MTEQDKDNTVVILSDDDEDEEVERHVINEHGKRVYYYKKENYDSKEEDDQEDEEREDEERNEEDYYEDEGEYQGYKSLIKVSQILPEDHESAIVNERDQENPLNDLNDICNNLKSEFIKAGLTEDDIKTNFAFGSILEEEAPAVAINVEGIVGPIAFPLSDKDAKRIINSHPTEEYSSFELSTSKILINLSFQEYLYENVLPNIFSRLGIHERDAKNSRLEANRFYICEEGKELKLPEQKLKGAFASVLVILPSGFSGGELEAKYNGQEIMFQAETDTVDECFYLAWYNDVEMKTVPIAAGYQVSIFFSLIYNEADESVNTKSLQDKRLTTEAGELTPIEVIKSQPYLESIASHLKTFTSSNPEYPILYMLNYNYTSPNIKIKDLKKSDKMMAKLLKKAAEKAECYVYIGSIDREVEATINKKSISEDTVDKSNVKDCAMDEEGIYLSQSVIQDELILSRVNDIDGENVLSDIMSINLKEHNPIIQGVLWYSRCKPETADFDDGTKDGEDPSVTYWYTNNTALVFVPKQMSLCSKSMLQSNK